MPDIIVFCAAIATLAVAFLFLIDFCKKESIIFSIISLILWGWLILYINTTPVYEKIEVPIINGNDVQLVVVKEKAININRQFGRTFKGETIKLKRIKGLYLGIRPINRCWALDNE